MVGLVALHFVTETVGCSLRGRHIPGVPLPRFTREGGRFARTGPPAAAAGEPSRSSRRGGRATTTDLRWSPCSTTPMDRVRRRRGAARAAAVAASIDSAACADG